MRLTKPSSPSWSGAILFRVALCTSAWGRRSAICETFTTYECLPLRARAPGKRAPWPPVDQLPHEEAEQMAPSETQTQARRTRARCSYDQVTLVSNHLDRHH